MTAGQEAPAGKKRLKMKDLERATGVGRESIRFYIREGLLPEPERPSRNVAFYDESFVDKIHFIKELQHKRYLPLHVIKAIVAGDTQPSRAEVETLLELDGKLFPHVDGPLEKPSERLSDLAVRTGLAAREIREIADAGALEIVTRDGDPWVEGAGVRMVELWARARESGFTPELGYGPELCRLHVDMVRWLAREELRIFTRSVAGKIPAEQAARMAEHGIDIVNQILALLRKETLLRYVRQGNLLDEGSDDARRSSAKKAS